MESIAIQQLTRTLSTLCADIAADLRQQMLADGLAQQRARRLHAEEKVGEDFAVWTDMLSRRAAVLWVLKSVYARVLEDRGLVRPRRIVGLESQQLFEQLCPNLGETAYLRWVYRDLAQSRGGLPELFASQPAEVAPPADALSRRLLELWRGSDADTGELHWRFDGERFDGQLMGDLYQDLDPVVKDRFALLQTPDFVRDFILDQTLTPAVEKWGADTVRVLDPACGSGHFLLESFVRLARGTSAAHPDWNRVDTVQHALARVVGIDLNDYACGLARARLVMKALELSGLADLADAGRFHPRVYWADALEQVERQERNEAQQLSLLPGARALPREARRAVMTRPEVRRVLAPVLAEGFHLVVANPPYITEKDKAKKAYHREKVGGKQRYVSAYREYSLASPFTERCFQVAVEGGYVGLITSNNFMKREFGKALITRLLAGKDLFKVVDTSGAFIPGHGTPTVILFARNRPPEGESVLAVMGKRGEPSRPADPRMGLVWSSIVEGHGQVGYESEFVSVAEVEREVMRTHPWSLGGGGAAALKIILEKRCNRRLKDLAKEIGFVCMTRADDIYFTPRLALRRAQVEQHHIMETVEGDKVRDWAIHEPNTALFPYNDDLNPVEPEGGEAVHRFLWPYRTMLWLRREPNGNHREIGLTWWEWSRFQRDRFRTPLSIAFAFVATHNHFVLDRGGKVFNRSAPVIKLPADATEEKHLWLLGLLNSSTLAFWMRQVFHTKGGESTGTKIQSEPWSRRLEYDSTKIKKAPISQKFTAEVRAFAAELDRLGSLAAKLTPAHVFESNRWRVGDLEGDLDNAHRQFKEVRHRMAAIQEELDWVCYAAYGLIFDASPPSLTEIEPLAPEHRPFELILAREVEAGTRKDYWFQATQRKAVTEVPEHYGTDTRTRILRRLDYIQKDHNIAMLEAPEHKRKWEPFGFDGAAVAAGTQWLLDSIESRLERRNNPASPRQIAAEIQDDERFVAVAEYVDGRRDVHLESLIDGLLHFQAVASHPYHLYTDVGLKKREVWESTWELQRREDVGDDVGEIPVPPIFSQGSRGKSKDFIRTEYWKLRGKLDVPKERFIAFTEVPGRAPDETLYGWAGWTPRQRVRAILDLDEELDDEGIPLEDRVALLDSAWRLLPEVARDDPDAASDQRAELEALLGQAGPTRELLAQWRDRFPPPGKARRRPRRKTGA